MSWFSYPWPPNQASGRVAARSALDPRLRAMDPPSALIDPRLRGTSRDLGRSTPRLGAGDSRLRAVSPAPNR